MSQRSSGFEKSGAYPPEGGGQLTRRDRPTTQEQREHLDRTRRAGVRFRSQLQATESDSGHQQPDVGADTYTDFLELEKEVGGHGMQVSCSIFASQVQFF